ncbi:MAG: hypothetical protein K2H01_01345 [Ruminococcus sp.]|nr:hypothetical protein [Ruminococcus sp.]
MSIQQFCSMNNVPCNLFEKYLVTRRKMSNVYPVTITDAAEDKEADKLAEEQKPTPTETKTILEEKPKSVRIFVSIKMTNGLSMNQGNLSYRDLQALLEKLEALC